METVRRGHLRRRRAIAYANDSGRSENPRMCCGGFVRSVAADHARLALQARAERPTQTNVNDISVILVD